jgi:hypothetical protein
LKYHSLNPPIFEAVGESCEENAVLCIQSYLL